MHCPRQPQFGWNGADASLEKKRRQDMAAHPRFYVYGKNRL
jgi:hypothetical protein